MGRGSYFAADRVLLAVSIAEVDAGHRLPPDVHDVIAGIAALAAGRSSLLKPRHTWLWSVSTRRPERSAQDTRRLIAPLVSFRPHWRARGLCAFSIGLTLGKLSRTWCSWQCVHASRECFIPPGGDAGADRTTVSLGMLAQVEALYERDPQAGDHMLDGLIADSHDALRNCEASGRRSSRRYSLPRVCRSRTFEWVTVGFRIEVHEDVGDCDFPPMVLLPLIRMRFAMG